MAMLAVAPTMPSTEAVTQTMPKYEPLFATGGYALYPLRAVSEEAAAKLFVKVCARGNPILQGKPAADLFRLGVALYNKSVNSVMGLVFIKGGEPVAITFGWDLVDGGAWKGTSGPPKSLACHAATGEAMFASMPHVSMPGQDAFLAFTGVAPPHPGLLLMHSMQVMACLGSAAAGYNAMFGFAVHAATIKQAAAYVPNDKGNRVGWFMKYSDIETTDPEVREELCSLHPEECHCSLTDVSYFMEDIRADARAHVQEAADALRPGAARLLAISQIPFEDGAQMPMASL